MASFNHPRLGTYLAGGTIVAGHAVKLGADAKHVVECTASTDKAIGVAFNGSSTLEDPVEVFLPGGGGKGVAHAAITRGQLVVPFTDGTLQKVSGANDRYVGVAMDTAAAGDVIPLEIVVGQATATES